MAIVVPAPPVEGRPYAFRICVGVRAVGDGVAAAGRTCINGCADQSFSGRAADTVDANPGKLTTRMNIAIAMTVPILVSINFGKNFSTPKLIYSNLIQLTISI